MRAYPHSGEEAPGSSPAVLQAQTLTVVLPIFNEELNLGRLFDRIDDSLHRQGTVYRIVAVDDGSTDRTAHVLEAYKRHILHRPFDSLSKRYAETGGGPAGT